MKHSGKAATRPEDVGEPEFKNNELSGLADEI